MAVMMNWDNGLLRMRQRQTLLVITALAGIAFVHSAMAQTPAGSLSDAKENVGQAGAPCSFPPVKGEAIITRVNPNNWRLGTACSATWTPYTGAGAGPDGSCSGNGTCVVELEVDGHPPGPNTQLAGALMNFDTYHFTTKPPTAANFVGQKDCIALATACANNSPLASALNLSKAWWWMVADSTTVGCYFRCH
jgi:hypothetical protein